MALPIRLEPTQINNLTQLRVGSLVVFYSYQTPIMFLDGEQKTVRDVSDQSVQTKTHVNKLEPEFGFRQPSAEFLVNLEAAMRKTIAALK